MSWHQAVQNHLQPQGLTRSYISVVQIFSGNIANLDLLDQMTLFKIADGISLNLTALWVYSR